jgi:hypothetical protein
MDVNAWGLNLCSGLIGTLAGGAITVWSTKRALDEQRELEDERSRKLAEQEALRKREADLERKRIAVRRFLVYRDSVATAYPQNLDDVARLSLHRLKDIMIDNE